MSVFLQRLRSRKLVQWALAYVAFAFALLQGVDIVAQRFAWPDQFERILILALAIGFLVALVLAWYHGERGAQRVSGTEIVILALLLAIGGGLLWRFERVSQASPSPSADSSSASAEPFANIPAKSIAVLPFVNMSGDPRNEYFSDGMSEELLNALAQVRDLKVAGHTSSFYYKGRNEDLRTIGKALGVANILEGSVRKQGNEVRITAQLIRVADDTHLWSHAYDGNLSDVFQLQENIARAITDQLKVVLVGAQKTRLVPVATTSAQAYTLYLKATDALNRRNYKAMGDAIGWLNQAIALDPDFARAHAQLAMVNVLGKTQYGASDSEAEKQARIAIALDPKLSDPYNALAFLARKQRRFVDARVAADRALELAPDDVSANFYEGQLLIDTGYTRQGIARLDRALAIDPMLPNALHWRAIQYLFAGDTDMAERLWQRAGQAGLSYADYGFAEVAKARGDYAKARSLAVLYLLKHPGESDCLKTPELSLPIYIDGAFGGDDAARAKALAVVDECLAAKPTTVPLWTVLGLLKFQQSQRALQVVEQHPTDDDAGWFISFWGPPGRDARRLPQFPAFAREVGLAALWDKYGPPDDCSKNAAGDYVCQ
ncbi:MAG TPA: hypothetical protein VFH71_10795 [Rhodanobacteraceae bacterium]|nr:hypothetical protein [Rhodanobacteraceae bacterium]